MATLQEVQNEIQNMQKAQEDRITARDLEMKTFMETLVNTLKGTQGQAAAEEGKTKDKDKDYNKSQRQIFDDKFVKNRKVFSGEQKEWKQLHFKFKNAVKIKSKDVWKLLEETEKKPIKWTVGELNMNFDDLENSKPWEQWSTELYDVLCDIMEGTALTQVQNIEDGDGIEAYRKLYRYYNPTTPDQLLKKIVK